MNGFKIRPHLEALTLFHGTDNETAQEVLAVKPLLVYGTPVGGSGSEPGQLTPEYTLAASFAVTCCQYILQRQPSRVIRPVVIEMVAPPNTIVFNGYLPMAELTGAYHPIYMPVDHIVPYSVLPQTFLSKLGLEHLYRLESGAYQCHAVPYEWIRGLIEV